jgi:hypothetical protein
MAHLKCDEWPDDDEPTTWEQQVAFARPAVAATAAFQVDTNRSRRRGRARQRRTRLSAAVLARRATNRMSQRVRPARSEPTHNGEAAPMPDLLARIVLHVPCATCGDEYPVPVRDVLDAQETLRASEQMWTDGCPNYCREPACDLQEHARLLNEADARNVERNVASAVAMLTRAGFNVNVSSPGRLFGAR